MQGREESILSEMKSVSKAQEMEILLRHEEIILNQVKHYQREFEVKNTLTKGQIMEDLEVQSKEINDLFPYNNEKLYNFLI